MMLPALDNWMAGRRPARRGMRAFPQIRLFFWTSKKADGRDIRFWVTNDACPPSPGCAISATQPSQSGLDFADLWQFAQSPRRKDFAAQCHNYNRDGNCYPPGIDPASHLHVDINTA